jgi:hypothetical protein
LCPSRKAYARRAKKAPDCGQPIIKLATATFLSKKFGKVPCPSFEARVQFGICKAQFIAMISAFSVLGY